MLNNIYDYHGEKIYDHRDKRVYDHHDKKVYDVGWQLNYEYFDDIDEKLDGLVMAGASVELSAERSGWLDEKERSVRNLVARLR